MPVGPGCQQRPPRAACLPPAAGTAGSCRWRVSCRRPPWSTTDPQGGGPWPEACVPRGGEGTHRRPGEPPRLQGARPRGRWKGTCRWVDGGPRTPSAAWGGGWPVACVSVLLLDVATRNHLVQVLVLRGRTETENVMPRCLGAPVPVPGAAGGHRGPSGCVSASPSSGARPPAEAVSAEGERGTPLSGQVTWT